MKSWFCVWDFMLAGRASLGKDGRSSSGCSPRYKSFPKKHSANKELCRGCWMLLQRFVPWWSMVNHSWVIDGYLLNLFFKKTETVNPRDHWGQRLTRPARTNDFPKRRWKRKSLVSASRAGRNLPVKDGKLVSPAGRYVFGELRPVLRKRPAFPWPGRAVCPMSGPKAVQREKGSSTWDLMLDRPAKDPW